MSIHIRTCCCRLKFSKNSEKAAFNRLIPVTTEDIDGNILDGQIPQNCERSDYKELKFDFCYVLSY